MTGTNYSTWDNAEVLMGDKAPHGVPEGRSQRGTRRGICS